MGMCRRKDSGRSVLLAAQMPECSVMILVRPTRKMSTMTGVWPRSAAESMRYRYLPTTDTATSCMHQENIQRLGADTDEVSRS